MFAKEEYGVNVKICDKCQEEMGFEFNEEG